MATDADVRAKRDRIAVLRAELGKRAREAAAGDAAAANEVKLRSLEEEEQRLLAQLAAYDTPAPAAPVRPTPAPPAAPAGDAEENDK